MVVEGIGVRSGRIESGLERTKIEMERKGVCSWNESERTLRRTANSTVR